MIKTKLFVTLSKEDALIVRDALSVATAGLGWYRDMFPEQVGEDDHKAQEHIDKAYAIIEESLKDNGLDAFGYVVKYRDRYEFVPEGHHPYLDNATKIDFVYKIPARYEFDALQEYFKISSELGLDKD